MIVWVNVLSLVELYVHIDEYLYFPIGDLFIILPIIWYLFVMVLIYEFLIFFFHFMIGSEGVLPVGLAIMSTSRFAASKVRSSGVC